MSAVMRIQGLGSMKSISMALGGFNTGRLLRVSWLFWGRCFSKWSAMVPWAEAVAGAYRVCVL